MLGEQPLNAVEVAQILHVGRNKVYELAQTGELASYRIGRKLRFSQYDVQKYLEAQRHGIAEHASNSGKDSESSVSYLKNRIQPEDGFVVAGTDVATNILGNGLSEAGLNVECRRLNGFAALIAMYLGDVDVALVDLYDARTNSYNTAFVQRLVPGMHVVVMSALERKRGFVVAQGNPKHITTWGSLLKEGIRIAQQEYGAGGRVLLDQKIMMMEARNEAIEGYSGRATDEYEAARRVALGEADVAICTERAASLVAGVSFVPMQTERLDVVMRKTTGNRELIRIAKKVIVSQEMRLAFEHTGGQCPRLGAVVYES